MYFAEIFMLAIMLLEKCILYFDEKVELAIYFIFEFPVVFHQLL